MSKRAWNWAAKRRFVSLASGSLLLTGAAACVPPTRSAPPPQDAAYARTPGDTLRYRKQSEWSSTYGLAGMPQSPGSRYRRDSRFAITFTSEGRARAWIESVRLEARGDTGRPIVQTLGAEVAGLPFVLAVGPRGSDSVVSRPRFPPSWELEAQFNGFFPRLPGGPLTPGREWTDSGSDEVEDSTIVTRSSRIVTYRVAGTERIRGMEVVAVQYHGSYRTDRRWRNPLPPVSGYQMPSVVSHAETEVNATFYFAPRSGRLVRHTWTSEVYVSRPSGHVEAAVEQTSSRVTIDLVSGRRE